jgi:hypothetical protein
VSKLLILCVICLAILSGSIVKASNYNPPPARQVAHWQCVGYSVVGWLGTATGKGWSQLPSPSAVYNAAQLQDGLSLPHRGTYTRAGFKVLEQWGYVKPNSEYYVTTIARSNPILQKGPVVVTFVTLGLAHSIFCYGIDTVSGKWRCQDSSRFLFVPLNGDEVWTAIPY